MYRVADTRLKRIIVDLSKGNFFSFAKKALTIPRLKKVVVEAVSREVTQECMNLCTTKKGKQSILRKTCPTNLTQFDWTKFIGELEDRAPVLLTILKATVKRPRRQHSQTSTQQSIGFAASILLHERNQFLCAVQCVNSLVLYAGHANKMV